MISRSISFLLVLYAGLFMLDSCGPKCPSIGPSILDYFFVEQAYETESGTIIEAADNGIYLLEKATTFRITAAVNTENIAQATTSVFSAYALSCVEPGLLMSDTKLDPESVVISMDRNITLDSIAYAAGSSLRFSEEITFSEDGFNSFFVSLSKAFLSQARDADSLFVLSINGNTFDAIPFETLINLHLN